MAEAEEEEVAEPKGEEEKAMEVELAEEGPEETNERDGKTNVAGCASNTDPREG